MNRAERKRAQREAEKEKVTYTLTAKQIADMRANAYDEAKKLLIPQYEKRLKDLQKVAANRAILYVLGVSMEIFAEECGWTLTDTHNYFERIRYEYNIGPDLLQALTNIDKYTEYTIVPGQEEILFDYERKESEDEDKKTEPEGQSE